MFRHSAFGSEFTVVGDGPNPCEVSPKGLKTQESHSNRSLRWCAPLKLRIRLSQAPVVLTSVVEFGIDEVERQKDACSSGKHARQHFLPWLFEHQFSLPTGIHESSKMQN